MDYIFHILILVSLYSMLAVSLDLVVGYAGVPSLGHASFALIGAYASSIMALKLHSPSWLSLFLASVIAASFGFIIGYPALKLKGDFIALSTLGVGVMVSVAIKNAPDLTGGSFGLPGIPPLVIFGRTLDRPGSFVLCAVPAAIVTYLALRQLTRRPFGRVLKAIREDEIAAASIGKEVPRFKITAFVVSGFFSGFAGALYAHYISFIDTSSFSMMDSILILLMVILGGLGTCRGPVIGATALVVIPELLRFLGLPPQVAPSMRQLIYGLMLTLLVMLRPQGLVGRYEWQ